MKKQSFVLHFFLFLALFLYCFIPAIFIYSETIEKTFPEYSYISLLLSLLWSAVCLFAIYNQKHENSTFSTTGIKHFLTFAKIKFQIKFRKCLKHYKSFFLTLLLIFLSGFILNIFFDSAKPEVPEKTYFEWFLFFLLTVFFASSEEILYRYYLPNTFSFFIGNFFHDDNSKTKRFLIESSELFSVILFSLAHRYLGIPAVIHAFISGVILRWNIKKTDTLVSVCLIHSLYNCIVFISFLL